MGVKKLCTSLSVSTVYLKTQTKKVCDITKAGNSINKHQIQLLASMNCLSFTKCWKTLVFRLEMKRILYDTEVFYSKETALGPPTEEKGTKGLKNGYVSCASSPPEQNSPASQNQRSTCTIKGPANRLWSTLPLFFKNIIYRSLLQSKFYRVTKYCNCSFRFLYSPL